MSIYIGKVRPSIMEEPIHKNILDFFSEYTPQKVTVSDDIEQQKKLKTTVLNGFISGEMSALIRKNENVKSRDCLILDLDDVIVTKDQLKVQIYHKFSRYDYALYPSVSNGLKGVRYRLILPLDRNVQSAEYRLLVQFFNKRVLQGIVNQMDESNTTWSQIQLLPVITQHNTEQDIILSQTGKQLETQVFLNGAKDFFKLNHSINNAKLPKKVLQSQGKKLYTGEFLDLLVSGAETGNRNNWLRKMTDKMLAVDAELSTIYTLVMIANENFLSEPLPISEINTIFKNRVRNHTSKVV